MRSCGSVSDSEFVVRTLPLAVPSARVTVTVTVTVTVSTVTTQPHDHDDGISKFKVHCDQCVLVATTSMMQRTSIFTLYSFWDKVRSVLLKCSSADNKT